MSKYSDFLKEKIISAKYGVTASFLEENGNVYIADGIHKIPFEFAYKDEWYEMGIVAATQLLNVTLMVEHSKGGN